MVDSETFRVEEGIQVLSPRLAYHGCPIGSHWQLPNTSQDPFVTKAHPRLQVSERTSCSRMPIVRYPRAMDLIGFPSFVSSRAISTQTSSSILGVAYSLLLLPHCTTMSPVVIVEALSRSKSQLLMVVGLLQVFLSWMNFRCDLPTCLQKTRPARSRYQNRHRG